MLCLELQREIRQKKKHRKWLPATQPQTPQVFEVLMSSTKLNYNFLNGLRNFKIL